MNERPRILLFTGDGKGKTTAAMGLALRAAGHGTSVLILQFVKAPGTSPGESAALKSLPDIAIVPLGKGFVPPASDPRFTDHAAAARDGLRRAEQAIASGVYPLIVLDELCLAVGLGLLPEADVLAALRKAPAGMCLVLTGRSATQGLIDLADTVTEMRCVKHAYDSGTPAQKGVEF